MGYFTLYDPIEISSCPHEWREVIDENGVRVAVACNVCGDWIPEEYDDE